MWIRQGQKMEYYIVNILSLGHFEFALVEFTSFLSFIIVSLLSSLELKFSVANKINSSNPQSQGLSLMMMFSQISLKS